MRRILVVLATMAVCATAACTTPRPGTAQTAHHQVVYAAVGASESVGVGADNPATQAWPQVLKRTALPVGTEFRNFGVSGSTAAEALTAQVPNAVAFKPTLVTVWLNVNDVIALVTATKYEQTLKTIVHALRRGGAAKVLVANTPPVEDLPAFARRFGALKQLAVARVEEYNASIARVVSAEGAILVDLHAAGVRARRDGTEASLISGDGFHPSTAGHAAIAAAFASQVPATLHR